MRSIVFLDRQHLGKPKKWRDLGASHDGVHETWCTSIYLHYCEWKLRESDIDVVLISDGWYGDRAARVNQYAVGYNKSVYVAAHVNAGGGDYGTTFYDHRSTNGQRLATHINGRLHQWCDSLHNKTKQIAARPDDWTSNAFNTIKRVSSPVAVCFEPFFIDCEDHKSLTTLSGLELVGTALAVGIKSYLED